MMQVLAFPPSLSEAFDTSGLSNISSAIEVIGMTDQLQQLTDNGFTILHLLTLSGPMKPRV